MYADGNTIIIMYTYCDNDFSKKSIYNSSRKLTGHDEGWVDEYFSNDDSTPINADNLNAMLNMLIYIRNVIGKTSEFQLDGYTLPIPDPDQVDNNRSVASYINEAFKTLADKSVTYGEGMEFYFDAGTAIDSIDIEKDGYIQETNQEAVL